MAATAIQTKGGFKFGCLFIPIFFGGFTIPVFMFAIDRFIEDDFIEIAQMAVVFGFMAFVFGTLGWTFLKGARVKAALRQSGIAGRAKIMSVSETGTRVNDQPQLQFQLMVNAPPHQPYTAIHREVVSAVMLARVTPGTDVAVRVHPQDPAMLMIDWNQP